MKTQYDVAVAVIYNDKGEVLISKRSAEKDHAGDWEFIGGKIEPGEAAYDALVRECQEEMNIQVKKARPLMTIPYAYEKYDVCLHVFEVTSFKGTPVSQDGQESCWADVNDMQHLKFPEANQGILRALILPSIYLLTPDTPQSLAEFTATLKRCFELGVRLCRVRQGELDDSVYIGRVIAALDLAKNYDVKIIMDGLPDPRWTNVAGWHLSSSQLHQCDQRPIMEPGQWLVASTHYVRDIEQANKLACDFAVVSPIKPTASHPNANPLGWPLFEELVREAQMPVYALGGMRPEDCQQAWRRGGQGVAGIQGLWSLRDNLNEVMPLRA